MSLPALSEFGVELYRGRLESALLQKLRARMHERAEELDFVARLEVPFTALERPLAQSKVALVTTGGLHRRGDLPFEVADAPFGDASLRYVAHEANDEELALDALYVDQRFTALDTEVALPRRALDALVADARVASSSRRHASFVGGLIRPYPGLERSCAELARAFRGEGAQIAIVIPTCSVCVQTAALVACELEARGLTTVALSLIPELTRIVGAPRALAVHFPFGAPCGDPHHAALHRAVLGEALALAAEAREPRTLRSSALAWRRDPQ